ncbi:MAG TPA: ribosome biogenesis GTP-binding protein YihA/YsxC [Acidiferrobacterales bacterium]
MSPAATPNPLRQASYQASAHDSAQLLPDTGREVAFAGRSNAGKSSALNAIVDQRGLAHTSKTPGRTQLINFFAIDADRRLVDLPGYGYAKVPPALKRHWDAFLSRYLETRESLAGLVLVMDARHPLTDFDVQMLGWCRAARLPVHVLLTKADKLSRGPATAALHRVERHLREHGLAGSAQLFSALKKDGVEPARRVLSGWLGLEAPGGRPRE